RAIDEPMARRVYRGHATPAQDFLDLVASGDRRADPRVLDGHQRSATQEAPGSIVRVLQPALRTRLHDKALIILSGSLAGKPFPARLRKPCQNGQLSSITDGYRRSQSIACGRTRASSVSARSLAGRATTPLEDRGSRPKAGNPALWPGWADRDRGLSDRHHLAADCWFQARSERSQSA